MAEKEKTKGIKKKAKKSQKKGGKRIFRRIVFGILLAVLVVGVGAGLKFGITLVEMKRDAVKLVSSVSEETFKASQTTLVYDTNGELITKLKGEKDVYYLEYNELPKELIEAVIAVEDTRFYSHNGIDLKGIARATVSLIKNRGQIHEGASTITQQLAKLTFLSNEQTYTRKLKEMFIAMELEKVYSKEQILEFYINNIYYMNGYYGIQAAAQGYFEKDASELTLSEIAFLTAIPNRPNYYDPYQYPDHTITRRNKILKNMLETEVITQSQYDEAISEDIKVCEKKSIETHDYVETYVINCATKAIMEENGFNFQYEFNNDEEREEYQESYEKEYANCKRTLYTEGYRIYTSIDFDIQEELQNAVDNSLSGFTAKEDGVYTVQGAGTCIDNTTGKVVAIVGGRSQDDLEGYTLNRAFQSVRQPGSALKPLLVYAPALERGYTQSSTVNDSQMSSSDPHAVSNSGNSYRGSITLRAAVMKSSNVATMRLYEELTPKTAWSYLEKMQFSHITDADLTYYTSCIGGMKYGVTTEEMASGYATLANDGEFRQPTCIEEITDATGNLITKGSEGTTKVYSKTAASRMTDVLQSVVTGGTGKGMKIDRFATAGKTGTTSEYKDGWFCGYTSRYTTAIWVGRDDNKTLDNLHGNTYPAYIWKSFMSDLHANLDSGEDLQTYTDEGVIGQESTSATTEAATTGSDGYNNDNTSSTGRMYSTTEAATTEAATTEVEVTTEENTNAVTEAETTTAEPAATPEGNNGESEE